MGAVLNERGSYESGVAVVRNWAEEIGIDENEFIMVDGSGLSRKNYITPMAVAKLLRYMTLQKNFLHFYNSLSAAAVDGTLKYRMVSSTAAQAVHAKTGSMSHIRNLSGYLRGRDGELYLFVMMMNNFSVPSAQISALQDDICTLLYDYSVSNTR
jgi:PBP4 family serine-type D-alanyl-D-alanine carboxypeptidase